MWKAISHSSHISCLSGSCLPPQIWQAQTLQVLFGLSLQALHTGPFCPVSKKQTQSMLQTPESVNIHWKRSKESQQQGSWNS